MLCGAVIIKVKPTGAFKHIKYIEKNGFCKEAVPYRMNYEA